MKMGYPVDNFWMAQFSVTFELASYIF